MYSVEDLLISHGYKPSRDLPGPREDNPKGRRQARLRTRAEHDLLNGYGDDPAAFAPSQSCQGKRPVSDSESRRSTPPGGHREHHSTSAPRTSEARLYSRPALAWSSKPQVGSDHAYRRRGQEISNLPGSRDREAQEVRGMARVHGLPGHMREGPWEVGGRTEQVTKKAVWEEELRTLGPAKWPNASSESWNESRKLGRHMSDGDGEKLFQDLYPFIQEEHGLMSQNKRKSRSLPRVLSPESLACTEIPISIKDGHIPGVPRGPPRPSNCVPRLDSTRNPEKGATQAPFPRPKFGRPVKPPSYSSSRVGENSGFQESDPYSYLTKSNDPRHDLGVSDTGLEPPVYVPPPSYKSPPQHIPNPYLEDTEPIHVSDSHSPQTQYGAQKDGTSCSLPPGSTGAGNTYGGSPGLPQGLFSHAHPMSTYDGCVQYIPFDDPRIRHIKLAPPPGFCEEPKQQLRDRQSDSGPLAAQEPAHGKTQHNGVLLHSQGLTPPSETEQGPASAHPKPQWLWGLFPRDGENGGFPDPRDHSMGNGPWAVACPENQASPSNSQGEDTCKSQTKLRKFEPGIQTKKSSKKKTNETIFCLVSIPVKSESHLPDIDTNNNDLKSHAEGKPGLDKSPALQEQSLLSMSSTDLELQALTGSMAGRLVLLKQDLEELEDKQTNDLKFMYLAKQKELKYSGLWPGHQYRDQQTQTSFPEEAKGSARLSTTEPGEPRSPTSILPLDPPTSEAPSHTALASSDQRQKPNAPDLRGQLSLSLSSNSAFSRTSSSRNQTSVPRAGPAQPWLDEPEAKPTAKPEVVKGEPTAAQCNSKQLFGQFLLKPVSRRPWDLISQLESFNKELQEEEKNDSGDSNSERSEADLQWGDWADSRPGAQSFHKSHQEMRSEQQSRVWEPEDSESQAGSVRSMSESWSAESQPRGNWPCFSSPTQAEGGRSDPTQWADAGSVVEQQKQVAVNGLSKLAVSPGPVKRSMASRPSDTKPADSTYWAEPKESVECLQLTRDLGIGPLSRRLPPKGERDRERDTDGPLSLLSLAHKTRGLSAPDLRSLGSPTEQVQSAAELEEALGEEGTVEIHPSESLQARAERILGIEVAVESLLTGTRAAGQSQPLEPEAGTCSPDLPPGKSVPMPAASGDPTLGGPVVTTDAFYGRRKCGWTESPLFVGERAPQAREHPGVDQAPSGQATSPEPQPSSLASKSFEEKDLEARPPFRSTLFHFIERTPNVTGSEKRLRSPSKVIESLQEKLASPPTRVDPDRLMRMKEVSSVSRMRCLSFQNADSTEEAEDPKPSGGQAWEPGDLVSLSSEDPAWRVGYPPSDPKGFTPTEENGHPSSRRSGKNVDPDFWCPESYDPSRVERV
ncbi:junctional cadherin 5-associated protein isoform 1-T2 [Thomomys bottae]